MQRLGIIALLLILTGCRGLTTLMCIDDIPDSKYAQFSEMGSLDTHILKCPDAKLGKLYYYKLKRRKDEN